ncbi:uncharacterized [Tachysurus ichikawai]
MSDDDVRCNRSMSDPAPSPSRFLPAHENPQALFLSPLVVKPTPPDRHLPPELHSPALIKLSLLHSKTQSLSGAYMTAKDTYTLLQWKD